MSSIAGWVWSLVAMAQAGSWPIAPLTTAGSERPTVGEFVPVDEVMTAEIFGVAVLAPGDEQSVEFLREWYDERSVRTRFPLLVVRHEAIRQVPTSGWQELGDARLHVLPSGWFSHLGYSGTHLMICTAVGCVATAGRATEWWSLIDEGLDADDGASGAGLDAARSRIRSDPRASKRILKAAPDLVREQVEALPPAEQPEALAIAEVFRRATLGDLARLSHAGARDAACVVRSAETCAAFEASPADTAIRVPESEADAEADGQVPEVRPSELPVRHRVDPRYPKGVKDDARCQAMVLVTPEGRAQAVEVTGCEPAFQRATEAALLLWRWADTGRAGNVRVSIVIQFRR